MSNTYTCQRGGWTFAVTAGGPGLDGGAVSQLMNSFSSTDLISQQRWKSANQTGIHSHRVQFLYAVHHHRETQRGTVVLGERKYWCNNNSEVNGAQTSQTFSRAQPWSLLHKFSEGKIFGVENPRPPLQSDFSLKQEVFSSGGWWLINIHLRVSPTAEAHSVFKEDNIKMHFLIQMMKLVGAKRSKRKKNRRKENGRWRGHVCS